MTQKNSKPYNDKKNIKNVKAPTKKRNFNNTTKIRIDKDRLNDIESLDTSFLEGRVQKKNTSKEKRELLLREKSNIIKKVEFGKKISYSLSIFCILILGIMAFFEKSPSPEPKKNESNEIHDDFSIDKNYLFVGDFHTNSFDFDSFHLDYHYVKVSSDELTVDAVSKDLQEMIYQYNPSVVFLQLGFNDLQKGENLESIMKSYHKIIDGIQENRPYALIYVESLYPIDVNITTDSDDEIHNSDIQLFNKELKKVAVEQNVEYIDMYTELSDEGVLKDTYSDDGIRLNDVGYRRVMKVINRTLDYVGK